MRSGFSGGCPGRATGIAGTVGVAPRHLGEAVLQAAKPCGRCEVTTTDQATGERLGPEPLATLATFRDSREFGVMFGMNLVTAKGGVVRVGEAVHVT